MMARTPANTIRIERFAGGVIHLTYFGKCAGNGKPPEARCTSIRSAKVVIKRWRRQFGDPSHIMGGHLLTAES